MEISKDSFVKVGGLVRENGTRNCEAHGDYLSMKIVKNVWSGCPICAQESILRQREEEILEIEGRRKGDENKRREQRLNQSYIPDRFLDRTLDNFVPGSPWSKNILQVCRDYAANFDQALATGKSLIFYGKVGTGKTHLSIGIAHEVLKRDLTPLFISVSKALRHVKATYGKGCDYSEHEAIELFIKPDLLILDEVGVQFGSDTERLILFEIVNGRYELRKPTILISNFDLVELEKFIGMRVMDRLREGGGKSYMFDWDSHRRSV